MNILIFSGNWDNRGDESAIRAMIDEIIQMWTMATPAPPRAARRSSG